MTNKIKLDYKQLKEQAKEVLEIEAAAILNLKKSIDDEFVRVVEEILDCSGRTIMTGMGKSGLIAKKLAATLASTGTPSFFLHPAEAIHGDLGMITGDDVVVAISNSGESSEVVSIIPYIKRIGARVIGMTGGLESTLAKNSDYILNTEIEREACPLNLAPTASTTAVLALGDALAIALLRARDFKPEDFALYHPGGSLGRKLLLTVDDVLHIREKNPMIKGDLTLKDTLFKMTESRMGAVNIVDDSGRLIGIITDGDVRRKLEESQNLLKMRAKDVMTVNPTTVTPDKLAAEALKIMESKEISDLPVVDKDGQSLGLVNFQDLLKAGVI